MQEIFLHHIWANGLYRNSEFTTHTGKYVKILDPGRYNKDAGPDFCGVKIYMDDVIWVGNIEVHLRSSDWYRHGHHENPVYDTILLSVVNKDDVKVFNSRGEEVECIVLEYADSLYAEYLFMQQSRQRPGCFRRLESIDDTFFYFHLQALAVERMERKVNDIREMVQQTGNDWAECLYRLLCKYWSGNVNAEPFYQLSFHLPYKILLKYTGNLLQIEALMFGVSGILMRTADDPYTVQLKREYLFLRTKHRLSEMNPEQWKYMRIRPEAFPTVRIALLASLINRVGNLIRSLPEMDSLKELKTILNTEVSDYWKDHYQFNIFSVDKKKFLGDASYRTILINAIVPFTFLYAQEKGDEKLMKKAFGWLEEEKAESNFIVKMWEECGFVFDTALQSQAIIQLYREYCEKHQCLTCRIGQEVFKSIIFP